MPSLHGRQPTRAGRSQPKLATASRGKKPATQGGHPCSHMWNGLWTSHSRPWLHVGQPKPAVAARGFPRPLLASRSWPRLATAGHGGRVGGSGPMEQS